jgi:radical SAM superfamily enzyme YgiQ (UPF0313 family)
MTPQHTWLAEVSILIKQWFPGTPVIVGGVHAVLYPEDVLKLPAVDYVCTGEGEIPMASFCLALRDGTLDVAGIRGLGYRGGDAVCINEREDLIPSISGHFEDREIYYSRYPGLRNDELKQFVASRGCPYACSFCFNEQLRDIFHGKGKYIRLKDAGHLLEEIRKVRASSGIGSIFFADDLFTMNKSWLREFLPAYKKEINIPFMCTTRANLMDEEIASLLSEAGCHTVSFGIETGNEQIRNEVLGKRVSDKDIINCAGFLRKYGIRIQTSNMFCLPDETLDDALSTVKLNIKIKADFAFSTLFMPFPGTRLSDYCIQKGYLGKDFSFADLPKSFLNHSILSLQDKDKIENVQKSSYFLIKYPVLLNYFEWIVRRIGATWPFYPLIFLGTFLRYKEERRISFLSAVRFLWRFRKSW